MFVKIMSATDKFFYYFGRFFLPFYLTNNPKYQYFEKIKETPGDTIILQMSPLNCNHMMYGS